MASLERARLVDGLVSDNLSFELITCIKGKVSKKFSIQELFSFSMGSKTKMQSNFIFCVALHYWKSKSRFENHFCVWLISRLFTPLPCIIHLLDEGVVFLPECHLAPVLSVVWCRTAVSLSCRYWELELHPALCWQDTQPARSVPVIFIIYYLLSGCQWS